MLAATNISDLTNRGDMFEGGGPHQAVEHLVLLLEHPQPPGHVLPQQPVLGLHVEDVPHTYQQRRAPHLRPQRLGVLTQGVGIRAGNEPSQCPEKAPIPEPTSAF